MESRKMVLMNLSAGKEWRHRHREHTCGHSRNQHIVVKKLSSNLKKLFNIYKGSLDLISEVSRVKGQH